MFSLARGVSELSKLNLPSDEVNIFIYKNRRILQYLLYVYSAIYPGEKEKIRLLQQAIEDYRKNIIDEPLLSGNEIMKLLNIKPSKELGVVKNELLKQQLRGKVKTKEEAVNFVKSFHQKLH